MHKRRYISAEPHIHASGDANQLKFEIKGTCNAVALGLHDASVAGFILKGSNLSVDTFAANMRKCGSQEASKQFCVAQSQPHDLIQWHWTFILSLIQCLPPMLTPGEGNFSRDSHRTRACSSESVDRIIWRQELLVDENLDFHWIQQKVPKEQTTQKQKKLHVSNVHPHAAQWSFRAWCHAVLAGKVR